MSKFSKFIALSRTANEIVIESLMLHPMVDPSFIINIYKNIIPSISESKTTKNSERSIRLGHLMQDEKYPKYYSHLVDPTASCQWKFKNMPILYKKLDTCFARMQWPKRLIILTI